MRNNYTGRFFQFTESASRVTEAVVTKDRIAVDWTEHGERANLVATSENGVNYCGTFGYPTPEPRYRAEFQLYKAANSDVLLFGRWWQTDISDGGTWIIRLAAGAE